MGPTRDRDARRARTRRGALAPATILLLLTTAVPGCLTSDGGGSDADTVTLFGFSVKGEVLEGDIIPAFQAHWRGLTGRKVEFKTVFAGSGTITNQVIAGAPGEVMILSTEWDAIQLRRKGLVTTEWDALPHNGTVTTSPWVILTREGNPGNITDFPDLARRGVEVIHPDPLTSGGARWSVFAVYGSVIVKSTLGGGAPDVAGAEALVEGVADNVISWPASARTALSQFDLGYGDALVTYECEALLVKSEGRAYDISYPQSTILSEHKVVIVDRNVGEDERGLVEAFVDFLFEPTSQEAFASAGFRPVDQSVAAAHQEFPTVEHPFLVDLLGGWERAQADLIDGLFTRVRGG